MTPAPAGAIYVARLREFARGTARVVSRVELAAIATAVEAAAEAMKGGAHEGPCDNANRFGPCELHVVATARRDEALRVALAELDALR